MTPPEVAVLLQDFLEIDDMAIDDNFFDMGGNSMLALKVLAAVEERCGVKVPLIDMIQAPTPTGMARLIARATR